MYTAIVSIVIFVFCVALFIWDRLPMATSAILGCALMVVFGVCDFGTAFGQFASSTVIMLIGVLVMGAAFSESGLADDLCRLISRASGNSERVFIAFAYVLAFFLSTFLTNATVLAILMPVIFSVSSVNRNISPLNVVIPITLAVNIGGVTTLFGSSQQMTAQGMLIEYGYSGFGVFDFSPFGAILGVCMLGYILFIGYPLGKRIWGERSASELEGNENVRAPRELDKRKAIKVCVIFSLTVFFYVFRGIPFTDIVIEPYVVSTVAALACIITGCITQKQAVTAINWNIVGRLGACLGLAKALSVAGGIELISGLFMKSVGAKASPILLFAFITFAAQLISLFVSNSTAISLALLVVMSVAPELSLNVHAYAMGIVLASSMGASCPLSGSTWGISMAAGYRFRDYFRYGIWADLLAYVIILVSVSCLMGLTS